MVLLGCTIVLLAIVAHAEDPTVPGVCCPPGSVSNSKTKTCEECPVGQFQKEFPGGLCIQCTKRYQYTDETGQTICKVCGKQEAVGKFWNNQKEVCGKYSFS